MGGPTGKFPLTKQVTFAECRPRRIRQGPFCPAFDPPFRIFARKNRARQNAGSAVPGFFFHFGNMVR